MGPQDHRDLIAELALADARPLLDQSLPRHQLYQKFAHRNKVKHVVMKHGNQKIRISRSHKRVVNVRNLGARDVSDPSSSAHVELECLQLAVREYVPPMSSRMMEKIEVKHVVNELCAVIDGSIGKERDVVGLAVERYNGLKSGEQI